jgi:hypothetical protein
MSQLFPDLVAYLARIEAVSERLERLDQFTMTRRAWRFDNLRGMSV